LYASDSARSSTKVTTPSRSSGAVPSASSIAEGFTGFSTETFRFLGDLVQNNNFAWMAENKQRYHSHVREPMKALFQDVGRALKPLLDPYLLPDELEITPKSNKALSKIKRSWSTETADYNEYYWGAFYRVGHKKQTDAQLFVTIQPNLCRVGFYVGESAETVRTRFRDRVQAYPEYVWQLIEQLGIRETFQFHRTHHEPRREIISIDSPADLVRWVEVGDYDLLREFQASDPTLRSPAFADVVFDSLQRVFPLFLIAVAEDYEDLIAGYLSSTSTDVDEEDADAWELIPYTRSNFRQATYLPEQIVDDLQALMEQKKQLVFYGPPGTGKTHVARHLAQLLIGLQELPPEQVEIVQFHPAYGYEDFVEGIRPHSKPTGAGNYIVDYPLQAGVFKRFCRQAQRQPDKPFVFIIDEINRGNIPRIFGELMLLLEYRNLDVTLPYSGERFRIPRNVYLIGTMNTADRSIALVDFALRRRFHFVHFPADPDLFERWLAANPLPIPYLGSLYRRLSKEAIDDPNFAIGPSHFMDRSLTETQLERIWRRSIIPYLEEYYYDRPAKAQHWAWQGDLLRGIRNDVG
jgi:5-methylcytosine-specific restriction enzyme B